MKIIKNREEYTTEKVNMFGDCERVLDMMKEERIFNINFYEEDNKFVIYEKCDSYFGTDLTIENCKDLSELFMKMANKLEATQMKEEEMASVEVYKEAMEKLNLELSKLQEHSLKRPPHTKEYRAALEEELEILIAKKALIKSETESITSKINTDKK